MYTHFFHLIISLLLIFTTSAMELDVPIIHTPITHLRSLEGKERKEFMYENRGKIIYFIQKVHHNNTKLTNQSEKKPSITNILTTIVYGPQKNDNNAFEITIKISKNKEVLDWLRHNGDYDEKENS